MADASAPIVPPYIYLPVRQDPEKGQLAEIRRLADGRLTLLAYTALDRLADGCGDEQPWVVIPTESVMEIKRAQSFDTITLDVHFDEHDRVDGQLA